MCWYYQRFIKKTSDELKHVTGQQQQPNRPQVSDGDELWLCFFKPRAVLETEAAYGSIRYSYGALDLLFTKKNPSLLKWPLLLQPSISAASNNLEGGANGRGEGKTWVHNIILCKRKLYPSKKIQNAWNKVLHPNCRPISFIQKSLNDNSLSF